MILKSEHKLVRDKYIVEYDKELKLITFEIPDNQHLNNEDILEMIADQELLLGKRKHFKKLIIAGKYFSIDADARKTLELKMLPADMEAHVFSGLAQRIMFNMFVKLRKNTHPLKAFSSVDEAKNWLNSIRMD